METRSILIGRATTRDPSVDMQEARAIAQLIQVRVRGVERPATAADVLELQGPPRYLLKDDDRGYIARGGRGWTTKQRDAMIVPDLDAARELRRQGREHGVRVRVVRLRRRGTVGLEASRLRPDLDASVEGDVVSLNLPADTALAFVAALKGATKDDGEH